jgi:YebC/PmpR family DNA-binding regulatory protein
MSGHSKWSTIKHRKADTDAKRSKMTTKIIREITIAAKIGGSDILHNSRLRLALEKARANNVSKENISRAIKRGIGEIDGADYLELRFEGYGCAGIGVIVECLSDNQIRTVADVRHAFSRYGGSLGVDGSVSYQFIRCGQFLFDITQDENKLLEASVTIDGVQDMVQHIDAFELLTSYESYFSVKTALDELNLLPDESSLIMKPITEIAITSDDEQKLQKILDALEDLDDVQYVYTNAVLLHEAVT